MAGCSPTLARGAVTGDPGHTPDQPTIRALSSQAARARIVCAPGRWRSPGGFLLCTSFSWRLCLRRRAPVAPAQKHLSGPPHLGTTASAPGPEPSGDCLGIAGGFCPSQPSPCWVGVALVCEAGGTPSPPWSLLGEARCRPRGLPLVFVARGLDSGEKPRQEASHPVGPPCVTDTRCGWCVWPSPLCFLICKCWGEVAWGRPRCPAAGGPCEPPRRYQLPHFARHTAATPGCRIPVASWEPLVTTMGTRPLPAQGAPGLRDSGAGAHDVPAHVCVCTSARARVHACVHVCACARTRMCTCACVCTCALCVCMCACHGCACVRVCRACTCVCT